MTPGSAEVTVVIVTYNSARVIEECLRPFAASAYPIDLVVIDNASADDSVRLAERIAPSTRIINSERNLGFAKAVNMAVAEVTTPYFMLLNPDAVVSSGGIRGLVELLEKHSNAAIASPLVHESGGAHPTIAAGFEPTLWRVFTHATGLSRLGKRWPFFCRELRFRSRHGAGPDLRA